MPNSTSQLFADDGEEKGKSQSMVKLNNGNNRGNFKDTFTGKTTPSRDVVVAAAVVECDRDSNIEGSDDIAVTDEDEDGEEEFVGTNENGSMSVLVNHRRSNSNSHRANSVSFQADCGRRGISGDGSAAARHRKTWI